MAEISNYLGFEFRDLFLSPSNLIIFKHVDRQNNQKNLSEKDTH
jgi:hypothetical protein